MAQKDMTQKTLESYNDVFADIVNVLLFGGKEVVKEDELENDVTNSVYKVEGKLHEQERDVSKFWKHCNFRIALFGMENQTAVDKTMPLRVMGYDGASYRQQLLNKQNSYYPVVTLVLYFGSRRWDKNRSLYECIDVPDGLLPYVNDYKINVFEIAHLTREQINLFKSDFKLVADYFVQTRESEIYEPMPDKIKHLWEILNLMKAVTGDDKFVEKYSELNEKEGVSMCEVVDRFVNIGIEQGIKQGLEQGLEQGIKQGLEQGIEQGIEQGVEQGVEKNRISTVIKLYKMDMSKDIITEVTDFTEDEIDDILKKNNIE